MKDFRQCTKQPMLTAVAAILVVSLGGSWGWNAHQIINRKAAMHLPSSMASLKADSLFYSAHAPDADGRKDPGDTSFFAEAERHYIDIDWYPNFHSLPQNLDTLIMLYGRTTVRDLGTIPWATVMVFDSLVEQLSRGDIAKAELTMSDLGHYVADAHQPLHCTINYDGRLTNNTGIHSRYESGMINSYSAAIVIRPDSAPYVTSVLDFVFGYIYHSYSLVDSVLVADTYAKAASGWNGSGSPPSSYYAALWQETEAFTEDQFQRATVALASLWYTAWVNAGKSTSVDIFAGLLPAGFRLEQNYPNPCNPNSEIRYQVSEFKYVRLTVYDILGREVATLVDERKPAGIYTVQFNGANVASGAYFYRLEAGGYTATRRLALLR